MEIRRASRGGDTADRTYQRTYKACISCRQRKSKCDLGTAPDGLPMGPPCARCRREQRECVFSEKRAWERRKRPPSEDNETEGPSRTRPRLSDYGRDGETYDEFHQTSPGNYGNYGGSALGDKPSSLAHEDGRDRQQSTSNLANSMMRTVVSSGNDALNILFEAAAAAHNQDSGQNDQDTQAREQSDGAVPGSGGSTAGRHATVGSEILPKIIHPVELSDASRDVLNVWEACRFVKMGWFTSREAVTLIDYFFKNMSPLSPILTNFYSDHRNHHWLVSRDPVLCCTILMISSRYHVLPGAGGESRNFFIHHRLWQHCQQLVMRLTFGQEKSSMSKIRSIGTIEALLLMSEWHPRSLHFPPEIDGWDSDLISSAPEPGQSSDHESSTSANKWLEDMIEPARRSDQMSWMLLGSALSLAHELGVFEAEDKELDNSEYEEFISSDQLKHRRQRVQRLLYVYINQLAWRIGCMSLMPQSLNHAILGGQKNRELSQSGDEWLTLMDSWMDLTKLAKSVTDLFFPSVEFARQQLHSGRYIGLLDHFRPLLTQWKERYLQPELLDKPFFNIIFIEYHFVRVYTHSVGMQAVVERALADTDPSNPLDEVRPMNIDSIDYEYIQEVIDGSCQILQKVTQLAEIGSLRFSPVRIFLRITSSSIFLMKALSLGTRQAKLRESLDILEKCIQALRSNALDDIHLSTRYATLLDMHVSRLRRNLLASSKSAKNNNSNNSRGPTSRSSMAPQSSSWLNHTNTANSNTPTYQPIQPDSTSISEMSFVPSLNDMAADDWLSLPFDPSMAPFGISTGGQFPAYEGGNLNFIWNLPS